ncbi:Hypothetical_protein [Hexamita inflata]|uniref:Hypothetical_protein n=1 Tax=Hexamita inflata TaxID=28002 RepID=A0AA86NQA5_9EUKA|nr:Hypothetical protein HINF_LOCUS12192 [Hexamita inflata]
MPKSALESEQGYLKWERTRATLAGILQYYSNIFAPSSPILLIDSLLFFEVINILQICHNQNQGNINFLQYQLLQLWEVELLFLVYYVSNYILKYFATSNADDKFQQIISSWRLFMNYSLTQEGQKYDFDRIRPQSTIQSRYLIFQKGKIEITTCNKRTAMTKINAVEDVQGRSTNSLNKLRQF